MRWALLTRLAWQDLCFDRRVSFFVVSVLVAVVAPLLLLFSLKFGVVSQLQNQLLNDPLNLEIKIKGSQSRFDLVWFEKMAQDPRVAFVIPLTRSINNEADMRRDDGKVTKVDLIPTKSGDPLMPRNTTIQKLNGTIISAKLAQDLNLNIGDSVSLVVGRVLNGINEKAFFPVVVEGILPSAKSSRVEAFITLPLLIEIENYIDGFQVSEFVRKPTSGTPLISPRKQFLKARIYVKNLDDVAPVSMDLRQSGIENDTRDNEIANVRAIDTVLSILFLIIALTSISGGVLSLSGSVLANIERKRKEISLLALFGLSYQEMLVYLVVQALILASLAMVSACLFYGLGSGLINFLLASYLPQGALVSALLPIHFICAGLFTLVLATLVAFWGGRRIAHIQPSESLREI